MVVGEYLFATMLTPLTIPVGAIIGYLVGYIVVRLFDKQGNEQK